MSSSLSLDSNIPVRWRPLIRIIWLICASVLITGFLVGMPLFFEELRQPCSDEICPPYSLSPVEAALLNEGGLSLELYAAYIISAEAFIAICFVGSAVLIFWRKSVNWIGVLASLAFLFIGLVVMTEEIRAVVRVYPVFFPLSEMLISVGVLLFMLLFYMFPDGRFAPRWLGYIAAVFTLIILVASFLPGEGPRSTSGNLVVTAVGIGNLVIGFMSQLYRYRHASTPTQRQQTKWVVLGIISLFAAAMYWSVLAEFSTLPPGRPKLYFGLTALPQAAAISFFPISVVIAMLRYRLWDVDLIVRRTLVYAILTGSLLLVYFGSVVVVQTAVNSLTGQQQSSQLTIALSTLLIAALFNPLRRRVQSFIDRRFYRRKYDAVQTLTQFAATARDEVSLEILTAELTNVVQETMQPNTLSIWLEVAKDEK